MITVQRVREVLNYDPFTGILTWKKMLAPRGPVGSVAGCMDRSNERLVVRIDTVLYLAHRIAWLHWYGEWPQGEIDHINMVQSDNRVENLRQATRIQNQRNTKGHKDSTSSFKGVSWDASRGKWVAKIKVGKSARHLGRFSSEHEAYAAYCAAALSSHGEFARIA